MRDYVLALCAAAIFLSLCNIILPDGTFKKYAAFACSLVLAAVMLSPLADIGTAGIFEGFDVQVERITKEQAEDEYLYYLKRSYEDRIAGELSAYGRASAEVADDLSVKRITIYASVETVVPREEIEAAYNPEKLEVFYE